MLGTLAHTISTHTHTRSQIQFCVCRHYYCIWNPFPFCVFVRHIHSPGFAKNSKSMHTVHRTIMASGDGSWMECGCCRLAWVAQAKPRLPQYAKSIHIGETTKCTMRWIHLSHVFGPRHRHTYGGIIHSTFGNVAPSLSRSILQSGWIKNLESKPGKKVIFHFLSAHRHQLYVAVMRVIFLRKYGEHKQFGAFSPCICMQSTCTKQRTLFAEHTMHGTIKMPSGCHCHLRGQIYQNA